MGSDGDVIFVLLGLLLFGAGAVTYDCYYSDWFGVFNLEETVSYCVDDLCMSAIRALEG